MMAFAYRAAQAIHEEPVREPGKAPATASA
jgi:hypothetical protein